MFDRIREPVGLAVWARVPGLVVRNGPHANYGGGHFDVYADADVEDRADLIEAALAEPLPGLRMSVVRHENQGKRRHWSISSKISFNDAVAILRAARLPIR